MNKKNLIINLLLLLAACTRAQNRDITLDDLWKSAKFYQKGINELQPDPDGKHFTSLVSGIGLQAIVQYDYASGNTTDTLLSSNEITMKDKKFPIESYEISADKVNILLSTDGERIYRHSTISRYSVWNRQNKSLIALMPEGKELYATLSPDGSMAAFIYKSDLYVKTISNGKVMQVTHDGSLDIYNGVSDWVYEEEFTVTRAYFWSPDSRTIAFYRFDDSKVPVFSMNEYHDSLYPTVYSFKYPKAGTTNPSVSILSYRIETGVTTPIATTGKYEYIPRIKWTQNPQELSIQFMNRKQDTLVLALVNSNTGGHSTLLTETSNTYIDINDALTFINKNTGFLWQSDRDGFNHIYRYSISGKLICQVTKGKWDVTELKGVDEKRELVYYESAESSPTNRDLYVVDMNGKNKKNLSLQTGFNNANFSADFSYYINTFSSAGVPDIFTLHSNNGTRLRILENNKALNDTLSNYRLGRQSFFTFTTTQHVSLNGWMIKPPGFDSTKKYPVLMCVYGGPGINTVNNAWSGINYLWYEMLAEKGYIIASIDNRGTGARGSEFQKCTYLHLGKLETEDQIEGAKYLGSLAYVDNTRVGIWGWSYGGYMAALCITKGAAEFKTAISVAPVTDWKYYDSIYTERYMSTPGENQAGYIESSPITYADALKGNYLLIHGTADDNVHFQNTLEWIQALEKANKPFSLMVFPDKNHSITGGNTRYYLFSQMTDFIYKNL